MPTRSIDSNYRSTTGHFCDADQVRSTPTDVRTVHARLTTLENAPSTPGQGITPGTEYDAFFFGDRDSTPTQLPSNLDDVVSFKVHTGEYRFRVTSPVVPNGQWFVIFVDVRANFNTIRSTNGRITNTEWQSPAIVTIGSDTYAVWAKRNLAGAPVSVEVDISRTE